MSYLYNTDLYKVPNIATIRTAIYKIASLVEKI